MDAVACDRGVSHEPVGPSGEGSTLAAYLGALQLFDSAFPSGRYTLSHGLETLSQSGQLGRGKRIATLQSLLSDQIAFGVAPSDGTALAHAHRAVIGGCLQASLVIDADARLTAAKLTHEARTTSVRTGRALLRTALAAFEGRAEIRAMSELVSSGSAPGNHATVVGVISAAVGVEVLNAVAGELWAFATSWTSACTRIGLLDHLQAQRLLRQARAQIVRSATDSCHRSIEEIASSTPLLDVAMMRHEQADVRIFAN